MTREPLSLRRVRQRLITKERAAEMFERAHAYREYRLAKYLSENMLQWGTA